MKTTAHIFLPCVFVLASCVTGQWVKADTPDVVRDYEYELCEYEAQPDATFTARMTAVRVSRMRGASTASARSSANSEYDSRMLELTSKCMRQKGYELK